MNGKSWKIKNINKTKIKKHKYKVDDIEGYFKIAGTGKNKTDKGYAKK